MTHRDDSERAGRTSRPARCARLQSRAASGREWRRRCLRSRNRGLASYELASWYGVFAPARVPAQIVGQLSAAVIKIVGMPDVREHLLQVGSEPAPRGSEELAQRVRSDLAKFAEIARIAGARVE